MAQPAFTKDPNDTLDYLFDFLALTHGRGSSDWLLPGETIVSHTVVADAGLNVDSSSITEAGTSVTAWLSGGSNGGSYFVTCHIITSDAREVDQTFTINVLESNVFPTTPAIYNQMLPYPRTAVSLARYANIIQVDEPAFWGVTYENQAETGCGILWTEHQRQGLADSLAEAQEEMEGYISYFMQPTYVTGTVAGADPQDWRFVDQQYYGNPFLTRYAHLLEFGVKQVTTIALSQSVSHTSDPAVIGPVPATLTDTSEVRVYLPGTEREVTPSKLIYAGGYLTIQIPRCRLVKEEFIWASGGVPYEDITNFAAVVDIKRVSTDPGTQVMLHSDPAYCASLASQNAFAAIQNPRLGIVEIYPGVYNATSRTWSRAFCGARHRLAQLNYLSGLRHLSLQAEMALIRLTHSKMPEEPCGCSTVRHLWTDDRKTPERMDRGRQNCPFGTNNGAWHAWKFAHPLKLYRGAVSLVH